MKKIVRTWLTPNNFTSEGGDYTARVDINGRYTIEDIVASMAKQGMEIKVETAIDVIRRFNREVADKVLSGYSVNTGLVNMRPVVSGVFYDKNWNPEQHKLYVSMGQSKELREAAAGTEVIIQGILPDALEVNSITDISTGRTDGNITRGRNVELRGRCIKVVGDNADVGVTLQNTETGAIVKLADHEIIVNMPSRLMLLIPNEIEAGDYELTIRTQYSKGQMLKKTRTLFIFKLLTVA